MRSTLVGSSAGCTVEWGAQRLVYSVDTPVLARAGTLSIIRQALVRRSRSVSMQLEDISRGAQWLVYSIDTPSYLFGVFSHCVQGFLQQASAPHLPESNVHDFLLVEIQISAPCQRE